MQADILKQQFTALYNAESDAIFRFCFMRTSDRETALDITQDTFVRFWDALHVEEKDIKNHRAFLFAIARNCIIDWYRKKKSVSIEGIAEGADVEVESVLGADSGKEEIEAFSEARILLEKLNELDPIYSEVLYLRFAEDLRPKEIAEIVGESVNVISVRINRGIKQLRTLGRYGKNDGFN